MEKQEVAYWVPCTIDGEVTSYNCSNCEEEEGADAPVKFRRCPNCNCRMVNTDG